MTRKPLARPLVRNPSDPPTTVRQASLIATKRMDVWWIAKRAVKAIAASSGAIMQSVPSYRQLSSTNLSVSSQWRLNRLELRCINDGSARDGTITATSTVWFRYSFIDETVESTKAPRSLQGTVLEYHKSRRLTAEHRRPRNPCPRAFIEG